MNTSFVFLANGFEEVEALTTIDIMRRAGMEVVTVSINDTLEAEGAHGVTVKADALISEVNLNNAEWLICPGGMPGASNLAACKPLTNALIAQNSKGGKIAAICASPSVIFGPLGLLEGKHAVCYPKQGQRSSPPSGRRNALLRQTKRRILLLIPQGIKRMCQITKNDSTIA